MDSIGTTFGVAHFGFQAIVSMINDKVAIWIL